MGLHGQQHLAVLGLGTPFDTHQPRLAGAIDIGIQQADRGAVGPEREREVGRHGGLAHAALGRGHGNDVAYALDTLERGLHRARGHRKTDGHVGPLDAVDRFEHGAHLFGQRLAVVAAGKAQIEFEGHALALHLQRTHRARTDQVGIQIGLVETAEFGFDGLF